MGVKGEKHKNLNLLSKLGTFLFIIGHSLYGHTPLYLSIRRQRPSSVNADSPLTRPSILILHSITDPSSSSAVNLHHLRSSPSAAISDDTQPSRRHPFIAIISPIKQIRPSPPFLSSIFLNTIGLSSPISFFYHLHYLQSTTISRPVLSSFPFPVDCHPQFQSPPSPVKGIIITSKTPISLKLNHQHPSTAVESPPPICSRKTHAVLLLQSTRTKTLRSSS